MRICLIRHAKVDINWPRLCNSVEFEKACKEYDKADIIEVNAANINADCKRIYISSLYRSKETARRLFPNNEYYEIDVDEVPLKSFMNCSFQMPLGIWNLMSRL